MGRLVELCGSGEAGLAAAGLRATGNLLTGEEEPTQAVLDAGFLPRLARLLTQPPKVLQISPAILCFLCELVNGQESLRKEAAWAASNVTAGTEAQIQAFIDAGLLPPLVSILGSGDFKVPHFVFRHRGDVDS